MEPRGALNTRVAAAAPKQYASTRAPLAAGGVITTTLIVLREIRVLQLYYYYTVTVPRRLLSNCPLFLRSPCVFRNTNVLCDKN